MSLLAVSDKIHRIWQNPIAVLHHPLHRHLSTVRHHHVSGGIISAGDFGNLLLGRVKCSQILPHCSRSLSEQTCSLFLREAFKHIELGPVFSVPLQIEVRLSGLLGDRLCELSWCLAGRQDSLDSVEHKHECSSDNQICVAMRIRRSEFESGSHRVLLVSHQADQNRSVSGRCHAILTERSYNADRSFISRLEPSKRIVSLCHKRIEQLVILEDSHQSSKAYRAHVLVPSIL